MRIALLSAGLALLLTTCAGPPPVPPPAPPDPFAAAHGALTALGQGEEFLSFTVKEVESPYLAKLRARSRAPAALGELRFHGVFRREHPKAAGALLTDRFFLVRAGDPRLYDFWDFDDLVALAAAQQVRLAGLADVEWFLHADAGLPPIDVEPDADPRRFRFHVGTSGVPDPLEWNVLELDADGTPTAIRWGR